MARPLPVPAAPGEPVPAGTRIRLDEGVSFVDRDLLAGGAPWRLLRLRGRSYEIARRWRDGGVVGPGEERFARTLVERGLAHPTFPGGVDLDDLDVVIPAYEDVADLDRLLAALDGLHVTVVDDASRDRDAVAACATRHGASLVTHAVNEGPSSARNDGAAATERAFLWFVDTDVTIADARAVAATLLAHFADPLVGAVAPRVVGTPGPRWRDRYEEKSGALDMGPKSGLVVPLSAVGYLPSACLLVRRAAFGDGFDEALRVGEDVDFVWRLHDQGWLVRYDATVVVTHAARPTWLGWWRQREGYGRSTAPLALRHGERLALFRTDALTLLTWGAALLGRVDVAAAIHRVVHRDALATYFADADDPRRATTEVVTRNVARAGLPLARALSRTLGPALLLALAVRRLRPAVLAVAVAGTAYRWRHARPTPADVLLGVADDTAYHAGVVKGAVQWRTLRALTPRVTRPALDWRRALGRAVPGSDPAHSSGRHPNSAGSRPAASHPTAKATAGMPTTMSER